MFFLAQSGRISITSDCVAFLFFVQKWLVGEAAAISLPETGLHFGYVFCFGSLVFFFA